MRYSCTVKAAVTESDRCAINQSELITEQYNAKKDQFQPLLNKLYHIIADFTHASKHMSDRILFSFY